MPIKSMKILLSAIALGALGACSTPMPCDPTDRLCAPGESNTRVVPLEEHQRAAPPPSQIEPRAAPADVQTSPVDSPLAPPRAAAPGASGAPPQRIGLLLPLRSESLGAPAEAVRAGFMAAFERDGAGFVVNLVETGDRAQEALDGYAAAAAQNDVVVGPLGRSAVTAIAASGALSRPTIALNHPETRNGGPEAALPERMLAMGLSNEDEARQVAAWASAEQPGAVALVISGNQAWQRRIAAAFAAEWKRFGNRAELVELPAAQGYLGGAAIDLLRARIESAGPSMVFSALDADQARLVRGAMGSSMPWYGTSSVNPGAEPGMAVTELNGVRLLDMPWEVNPGHPAVMGYPRWNASAHTLDMDRLYALGIDAFRVAREIALHPASSFTVDGVTGRLRISFGQGPSQFERTEPAAVYEEGAFRLVTDGR